jgi:hypothetical protein
VILNNVQVGIDAREDYDMYMGKFKVCGFNVKVIAVSEICVYYVAEGHFFQLQFV